MRTVNEIQWAVAIASLSGAVFLNHGLALGLVMLGCGTLFRMFLRAMLS